MLLSYLSAELVEEEAGGSCRKSDFILKTLSWTYSGEYFVRELLFYGTARAINQLVLLHAAKTKNYGRRETKTRRRRWTNRSFGRKM